LAVLLELLPATLPSNYSCPVRKSVFFPYLTLILYVCVCAHFFIPMALCHNTGSFQSRSHVWTMSLKWKGL
jgi:hypothetical protein